MNSEQLQILAVLAVAMLPVALLWWVWIRMLDWSMSTVDLIGTKHALDPRFPHWRRATQQPAMSSYRICRDDGISDGITGQVFDSYDAAYALLESY
jgi:hypothetical protein